jgi:hypothetical protein
LLRLAVGAHTAEDHDLAGIALCQEEIAVGRCADEAGILQAGGVKLHLEAFGGDGPRIVGSWNHRGAVVHGLIGSRGGQVGDRQVAADAGSLVSGVGECRLASKNGMLRRRFGSAGCEAG